MNVKNFFLVSAIVSFVFGILLIAAPQMMSDSYLAQSESVSPALAFVDRLYGALLIAFAVTYLLARQASMSYARRAILVASVVGNLLALVFHVHAITTGLESSSAWLTVVLLAFLAIWGGMLLNKEKVGD